MKLAVILIGLLLVGLLPVLSQSAPRWLSLEEVLKKWDGQSLEAARQAAEKEEPTACHYLGYAYAEGLRGASDVQQGIAWYERGIALNYLPSASNLGLLYFRGELVPRDVDKALHYYRLAADGGFPNAQAMLGFICEEGNGVKQDHAEAVKWLRRAADQGNTEAMVHLGRHYRFAQGVPKDLHEASKWFRTAADKGEPAGTLNLGWVYGYEQDDQAAASKCFREAAQQGLSEAMYELYLSYWNGKGVAPDRAEAKKWLTQSAEGGLAKAQYRLGSLNDPDPVTRRSNLREALRWYRRAVDQNWPGGQLELARFYLRGTAVEQDEARALELVRAAADQEYPPAIRELAELYARGIGEPRGRKDEPLQLLKRVTQLQKPGEQSVSEWAYQEIVLRYQYGLGIEKDLITAAQWYCRGSEAGVWFFPLDDKTESRPRFSRGETATATPDARGAIDLIMPERENDELLRVLRAYLQVATTNDGPAAMQLGECYFAGRDAPRDAVKAWCWFKIAAGKDAPGTAARIAAAEARMTSEQRSAAASALAELNADLRQLAAANLQPVRELPEQP